MRLIVITAGDFFDKEPEAIHILFGNGMEALHVRKPNASYAETKRFIERIDEAYHSRIILHDHYGLTGLFTLKGIHVNSRNNPGNLDFYSERGLSISCSCHSIEEVAGLSSERFAVGRAGRFRKMTPVAPAIFDYMFLSPIFDSISKTGYKQGFTPGQLSDARDKGILNNRVIALGGITAERIPAVHRYGFGGVAVLGSLWAEPTANGNMDDLQMRFDKLRNSCRDASSFNEAPC
jgi:thiamine-phosphate pyrophosphorylase